MKSQHVLESLRRHVNWLQPQVHDEIVAGLRKDGLVDNDGDGGAVHASDRRGMTLLTPIQAMADPQKRRILQRVRSEIRQLSTHAYDLPMDAPVDLVALNNAIRGANVEKRIACKAALAEIGLIK